MRRYAVETWSPEKGWTARHDHETKDAAMHCYVVSGAKIATREGDRAARVVDTSTGIELAWKRVSEWIKEG